MVYNEKTSTLKGTLMTLKTARRVFFATAAASLGLTFVIQKAFEHYYGDEFTECSRMIRKAQFGF